MWLVKIIDHIQVSIFQESIIQFLFHPFFSSFSSSFKLFTVARELKGGREIREEDKTKIGSFCYLLSCSVLFCFIMFTVGKDQNKFSMMKIPFSLASVFINKTKQTTTKTTSSFSSQRLRLEGGNHLEFQWSLHRLNITSCNIANFRAWSRKLFFILSTPSCNWVFHIYAFSENKII